MELTYTSLTEFLHMLCSEKHVLAQSTRDLCLLPQQS